MQLNLSIKMKKDNKYFKLYNPNPEVCFINLLLYTATHISIIHIYDKITIGVEVCRSLNAAMTYTHHKKFRRLEAQRIRQKMFLQKIFLGRQ